jgi:hypothetical protein
LNVSRGLRHSRLVRFSRDGGEIAGASARYLITRQPSGTRIILLVFRDAQSTDRD